MTRARKAGRWLTGAPSTAADHDDGGVATKPGSWEDSVIQSIEVFDLAVPQSDAGNAFPGGCAQL